MAGASPVFRLPDISERPKLSPITPITPISSPNGEPETPDENTSRDIEVTEGNTEIHNACCEFNVLRVEELLQEGASVDRVNIKDRSCLHEMALSYLSFDIVDQAACYKKLVDIITLLAKAGLDLNMTDINYQTPLHYVASYAQQDDLIKVLFSAGVKVNSIDKHGETPLHGAARKGDPINVMALLEGGANPNLTNRHGYSPLHMAAKGRHHREVMKHLLSCGGIVDDRTRAGKTPLHIAAKAGRLELVEILLRHHAHPSVGDNTGQTPLHLAAGYDMTGTICKALLKRKADINAIDQINQETPLHKAVRMKMIHNIDILVQNRAKLNIQDVLGDTPLHKAAQLHETWAWKNLLHKGRKYIGIVNGSGKTALQLAQEINNQIAVSLMRIHSVGITN